MPLFGDARPAVVSSVTDSVTLFFGDRPAKAVTGFRVMCAIQADRQATDCVLFVPKHSRQYSIPGLQASHPKSPANL
ncbi:hypothetical protein VTN77DRAFT_287 [Rasamsonia byssochlamydoides]|uniref:uncharacterized protein n=1 Tax=Rasamsonia byssochlamydoides TaxID=89139 RepID=UPI003742471E